MKIEKNTIRDMNIILGVVGVLIFLFNILYINYNPVNIVALLLMLTGPVYFGYTKHKNRKEVEEKLPRFLRDVAENIRVGMSVPQAMIATKQNDYGGLSKYVERMATQMDWGIPFDKIMEKFAKNNTQVVKRAVSTIIESYSGGGNVAQIFEAVAKNIEEINTIRTERESMIYTQMVTGYIIFFVFLGVLVALQKFLLPSLGSLADSGLKASDLSILYSTTFQRLIIIQGFFSGLFIGKISEGHLIAGLKHSLIMMVIGYSVLIFFI